MTYKTLIKDIKKSYTMYTHFTQKKTRYIKMMILPKLFYKFNVLLIKILKDYFT